MPDTPDPRTVVRIGVRLWSDEVGAAAADSLLPAKDPGYEFSNGRRFDDGQGATDAPAA